MSRVRADRYTNRAGTGSPTFSEGVNVVGISSLGITTVTGVGQTALTVNGDARITGVLTVGQGSVTIDGTSGNSSITGVTTVGITSAYITSINDLNYPTAGPLSNRNLIINGAMQVAQRGTQVTGVASSGYRTVDRFRINFSSLGTWTIDQATDAPAGFTKSFKATCTTADASPAATDSALIIYQPEAQDLQLLDFGASGAKSITLSFWVKSNKTGAATIAVLQTDNSSKLVSFAYSISSANTWEQKTITIPGDTAGVINDDNGPGLQFEWWLNSGSDNTAGSHRVTWTTFAEGDRNPSNLGVGGATSDYFAITGVQLEVGSVATPFEHRSYGDELARCQRYYQRASANSTAPYARVLPLASTPSTTAIRCIAQLNPPMRAVPTYNQSGSFGTTPNVGAPVLVMETNSSTAEYVSLLDSTGISGTVGSAVNIFANNDTSAYVEFTAEL